LHVFLASSWLDPFVNALAWVIDEIHRVVPNLGLCLVILAAAIRMVFWPLNTKQFMAMLAMQKIAPQVKKLQERYAKSDPQKYQQETMALYKTAGANPLAGCWPMLVQYPIIISVYYVVSNHRELYANTGFAWIGSHLAALYPGIIGASLATADVPIVLLYAVSLYISMRYTTMPPTDPQQVQTMKIMQIASPLMLSFFAFRAHWPSAMVLYWFAYNVFTMGQQFYLLRKYHQPLSAIDSDHAITENLPGVATAAALPSGLCTSPNGSRKRKKGAKKR
jgi:YidC/Oxa1 family membrane protein insertase